MASYRLPEEPGLAETTANLQLIPGVVVVGRITDMATGKPIEGAGVQYSPLAGNAFFDATPGAGIYERMNYGHTTDAQGVFRLVAFPGIGLIRAQGQTPTTVLPIPYRQVPLDPADEPRTAKQVKTDPSDAFLSATDQYLSLYGQSAYKIIEPAKDIDTIHLEMQFDPGKTVSGKVIDPDGKPAAGVVAQGLEDVYCFPRALKYGKFTVLALDPSRPRTVTFEDEFSKLSATVQLTGEEKQPLVVKLQPK